MTKFILTCLFSLSVTFIYGQQNTVQLTPDQTSPLASLTEISWIAGQWKGEAFGGQTEEVWLPPSGGSMMGAFKLHNGKEVSFYELCIIREVENSLILQLKHFHEDLKGWEEKDQTVDFPLVKIEDNRAYFAGFTFENVSDDQMNIYVLIGDEDNEVKFEYFRVK